MHRDWDRPFPSPREAAEQIAAIRKETTMVEVKINVAALNTAYKAALAKHETAAEKASRGKRLGFAAPQIAAADDICLAWEAVQPTIDWLLKYGGWLPFIGTIRNLVAMLEAFMPMLCTPSKSAPVQPRPAGGGR